MAVNTSRSMVEGLHEGGTDGKYRKARPDTEVMPYTSHATTLDRHGLHPFYGYGYADTEAPVMVMGDGTLH
jgi:hypothetical protein